MTKIRSEPNKQVFYKDVEKFQILLTGVGKKVLEIHLETNSISKILKECNYDVVEIEVKSALSKQIEKFEEKILIRDLESSNLNEVLSGKKFDVILLNNILPCLKDPVIFLKQLHEFLTQNGHIVFSVPNVTNVINRIKFLNGEFRYEQDGLIENNQLRFFTLNSILSMLDASNYSIIQLCKVKENSDLLTRTDIKYYSIPEELVESILRDNESTIFQYVISATPISDNSLIATKEWLSKFPRTITTERLKEFFQYYKENYSGALLKSLQTKDAHISEMESIIRQRDAHISEIESIIRQRDAHISEMGSIIKKLHDKKPNHI